MRPLAVKSGNATGDWLELSRKHAIDLDRANAHMSIFGGKITDCLNVGDEVCAHARAMGIALSEPSDTWYGELMSLDDFTHPNSTEPLTRRFWRRYGANAIGMLERIRENPEQAQPLMRNTDYLRCEVEYTGRREMVTRLEDFLRRRSKITLVVPEHEVVAAPGLHEASRILFGERAEEKFQQYIDRHTSLDVDAGTMVG